MYVRVVVWLAGNPKTTGGSRGEAESSGGERCGSGEGPQRRNWYGIFKHSHTLLHLEIYYLKCLIISPITCPRSPSTHFVMVIWLFKGVLWHLRVDFHFGCWQLYKWSMQCRRPIKRANLQSRTRFHNLMP